MPLRHKPWSGQTSSVCDSAQVPASHSYKQCPSGHTKAIHQSLTASLHVRIRTDSAAILQMDATSARITVTKSSTSYFARRRRQSGETPPKHTSMPTGTATTIVAQRLQASMLLTSMQISQATQAFCRSICLNEKLIDVLPARMENQKLLNPARNTRITQHRNVHKAHSHCYVHTNTPVVFP